MAGLADAVVAVDRVGRLQEGAVDLGAIPAPMALWDSGYRIAAGTGLALTLSVTVQPPGPTARPMQLLLIGTAWVTADGTGFVVPLQRTALLID